MLHLKLSVIDGVEAHESAKEPPVRFDNAIAEKVSLGCQALFQFIERVE
jgi:hypothetical protein